MVVIITGALGHHSLCVFGSFKGRLKVEFDRVKFERLEVEFES